MQQKFFFVLLFILTTSFFISFQSADAATDYFLNIEGIDGESKSEGHENEIDVLSWSWGETNTGSSSAGGGGAGKVSMQDIHFTKKTDKSSPKLFLAVASGQHIPKAIMTAQTTGENPREYLEVTLEDIMVTSYSIGGSSGDKPTENVSLNFAKFTLKYTETKSDGTLGEISRCWNVAQNQVCTSGGGDPDSDGDGTPDSSDFCPADPDNDVDSDGICGDVDNCPADSNAGQLNSDSDLAGNACDADDDNDGVLDGDDIASLDPDRCRDADNDDCDDCAVGADGFGALDDFDPNNDGTDTDGDMMCDSGGSADFAGTPDADDDNDGVLDADDVASLDPSVCEDSDNDTCDDCSVGTDGFGPQSDNNPSDDGPDNDVDGVCDAGDNDDDNDGLYDDVDVEPLVTSREFSNSLLGGNEFGTVLSGFVIVTDVGSGEQLSFSAVENSQVSACDLAVITLNLGDEVLVDCGSITIVVVSGSVTAEYTVGGETATATLDEGDSLTFDPDTASFTTGDDAEVEITIGNQTITIGANQTVTVHSVDVDIKPDDVQNVVNPQAKGVLVVAILSSAEFDATTIDPLSVKFGPNQATESHRRGHIEDVNRDGLKDMVLHFNIQNIGISENTTELELFGRTTDGDVIMGSDNIVLKGQKIKQN